MKVQAENLIKLENRKAENLFGPSSFTTLPLAAK